MYGRTQRNSTHRSCTGPQATLVHRIPSSTSHRRVGRGPERGPRPELPLRALTALEVEFWFGLVWNGSHQYLLCAETTHSLLLLQQSTIGLAHCFIAITQLCITINSSSSSTYSQLNVRFGVKSRRQPDAFCYDLLYDGSDGLGRVLPASKPFLRPYHTERPPRSLPLSMT